MTSKLLRLVSSRISNKQSPIIPDENILDLLLLFFVNELLVVRHERFRDALTNCICQMNHRKQSTPKLMMEYVGIELFVMDAFHAGYEITVIEEDEPPPKRRVEFEEAIRFVNQIKDYVRDTDRRFAADTVAAIGLTNTMTSKLLRLVSSRISNKQSPIIPDENILDLLLLFFVNELLVVRHERFRDALTNCICQMNHRKQSTPKLMMEYVGIELFVMDAFHAGYEITVIEEDEPPPKRRVEFEEAIRFVNQIKDYVRDTDRRFAADTVAAIGLTSGSMDDEVVVLIHVFTSGLDDLDLGSVDVAFASLPQS
ncbi:hypothetical protein L1987_08232 [Smallanthus sonchifolius]|uniref:Uncharacterized protein n=1 Tax=Smallanthus sonchifolius TaxID=185202 RepID=A0ACB9JKH5_9ASTR|nr:hypothetical protein L1987_08232 [Smallanthus sonchifolius]